MTDKRMVLGSINRVIDIFKNFNFETVAEIQTQLRQLYNTNPKLPIILQIMCNGGNCDAGFGLYDFIRYMLKPNLTTIALGRTGSMAVILYLAGNRRLITKHSHIFLHEIGTNYDKETKVKISDIDKKHNYLNYQKRKYIDIIYNTTQGKLAKPTIEKMMLEETYLLPKEAKKYGLAHEIID